MKKKEKGKRVVGRSKSEMGISISLIFCLPHSGFLDPNRHICDLELAMMAYNLPRVSPLAFE